MLTSEPVGIIAGQGELPLTAADAMERAGRPFFVAALEGIATKEIEQPGRRVAWIPMGKIQTLIDTLKREGVRELILIGRVSIRKVFDPGSFDLRLVRFMMKLKDRRGNAILAAVVHELEKEGFTVLSNIDAVPELLAPEGHLAGPRPDKEQWRDIAFGWKLAKEISRLDVGQTVVVRGRTPVAVEAMEGTDLTIRRAGELMGKDLVTVKVASPDHDFRFDVPTAGPTTVRTLAESGGRVLAVEAARSFLLNRDEVEKLCRQKKVSLVGVSEELLKGYL